MRSIPDLIKRGTGRTSGKPFMGVTFSTRDRFSFISSPTHGWTFAEFATGSCAKSGATISRTAEPRHTFIVNTRFIIRADTKDTAKTSGDSARGKDRVSGR